jgi:hypothetical protein
MPDAMAACEGGAEVIHQEGAASGEPGDSRPPMDHLMESSQSIWRKGNMPIRNRETGEKFGDVEMPNLVAHVVTSNIFKSPDRLLCIFFH